MMQGGDHRRTILFVALLALPPTGLAESERDGQASESRQVGRPAGGHELAGEPLVRRVGSTRQVVFTYWHETGGHVLRHRFLVTDDFDVTASLEHPAEQVGPFHF